MAGAARSSMIWISTSPSSQPSATRLASAATSPAGTVPSVPSSMSSTLAWRVNAT
jgi:hypothetical protein